MSVYVQAVDLTLDDGPFQGELEPMLHGGHRWPVRWVAIGIGVQHVGGFLEVLTGYLLESELSRPPAFLENLPDRPPFTCQRRPVIDFQHLVDYLAHNHVWPALDFIRYVIDILETILQCAGFIGGNAAAAQAQWSIVRLAARFGCRQLPAQFRPPG